MVIAVISSLELGVRDWRLGLGVSCKPWGGQCKGITG